MNLIESSEPDIVIMPLYMKFWNAEDLIRHLLLRGSCPQFILVSNESAPNIGYSATEKVACIFTEEELTTENLINAISDIGTQVEDDVYAFEKKQFPRVQHSLELMELLTDLGSFRFNEAQSHFGRLKVGTTNCWLLLGAPMDENYDLRDFNFFTHISSLEEAFENIINDLESITPIEISVYRENNLCILLEENASVAFSWNHIISVINQNLNQAKLPSLLFELSDRPAPLEQWSILCKTLMRLRDIRFFYSPPYMQPKQVESYYKKVEKNEIHETCSSISLSFKKNDRKVLEKSFEKLENIVSRSMSHDIFSYVMTQFSVIYTKIQNNFGIGRDFSTEYSYFKNVHEAFSRVKTVYLELFSQIATLSSTMSPFVIKACSYINQNLNDDLTLDTVAEYVHISPGHLSRSFKQETGF
ncbi:MAG TPA: hypothetical protein GX717_07685, partial [Clostridiaceae bacterium]|nr:hypothetical protein [Clostridiaceae bacterium]